MVSRHLPVAARRSPAAHSPAQAAAARTARAAVVRRRRCRAPAAGGRAGRGRCWRAVGARALGARRRCAAAAVRAAATGGWLLGRRATLVRLCSAAQRSVQCAAVQRPRRARTACFVCSLPVAAHVVRRPPCPRTARPCRRVAACAGCAAISQPRRASCPPAAPVLEPSAPNRSS